MGNSHFYNYTFIPLVTWLTDSETNIYRIDTEKKSPLS